MGQLVPARDLQHARPRIHGREAGRTGKRIEPGRGDGDTLTGTPVLVRYSVNAIRRLLAAALVPTVNALAAIDRERWRMIHKTSATISSYRKRGDPLPVTYESNQIGHQDMISGCSAGKLIPIKASTPSRNPEPVD